MVFSLPPPNKTKPKPHSSKTEEKLHTLAIWRALSLSGQQQNLSDEATKSLGYLMKGQPVTAQHTSHWISDCIKVSSPQRTRAHSTRVRYTSSAFLSNKPTVDICKAAITWSLVHIFFRHYSITQASQGNTIFGKSVLQSLFKSYHL